MFKTLAEIKAANKSIGHYFFSRDTMRFHDSRILPGLYGGRFFVTSERHPVIEGARAYSVRMANRDGSISSNYHKFEDPGAARDFAKQLARGNR